MGSRPQGDDTPVWQLSIPWGRRVLTKWRGFRNQQLEWENTGFLFFLERFRNEYFYDKTDGNPQSNPHRSDKETNYRLAICYFRALAVFSMPRLVEERWISRGSCSRQPHRATSPRKVNIPAQLLSCASQTLLHFLKTISGEMGVLNKSHLDFSNIYNKKLLFKFPFSVLVSSWTPISIHSTLFWWVLSTYYHAV